MKAFPTAWQPSEHCRDGSGDSLAVSAASSVWSSLDSSSLDSPCRQLQNVFDVRTRCLQWLPTVDRRTIQSVVTGTKGWAERLSHDRLQQVYDEQLDRVMMSI